MCQHHRFRTAIPGSEATKTNEPWCWPQNGNELWYIVTQVVGQLIRGGNLKHFDVSMANMVPKEVPFNQEYLVRLVMRCLVASSNAPLLFSKTRQQMVVDLKSGGRVSSLQISPKKLHKVAIESSCLHLGQSTQIQIWTGKSLFGVETSRELDILQGWLGASRWTIRRYELQEGKRRYCQEYLYSESALVVVIKN